MVPILAMQAVEAEADSMAEDWASLAAWVAGETAAEAEAVAMAGEVGAERRAPSRRGRRRPMQTRERARRGAEPIASTCASIASPFPSALAVSRARVCARHHRAQQHLFNPFGKTVGTCRTHVAKKAKKGWSRQGVW